MFLLAGSAHGQERAPHVLVLHAYHFSHPANNLTSLAARQRLLERSPRKPVIDAEFLDLVRFNGPENELLTANFIHEKYEKNPPDLILTVGGEALPFILKYRDVIAPGVPVIFSAVSRPNYATARPPADVTGILLDLDLDKTIGLAESLQPRATRLYLIAGSGAIDRRWQATARKVLEERPRKFETHYLFELPYEQLLAEVAQIPPDAIVLNLTVFADGTGRAMVPEEVSVELSRRSPAPFYTPYSTSLGKGILGGYSETFESVGVALADMALEVLNGADPRSLPARINPGQAYRVDYNALRRWGLSEDNLPPGTIVMFKPPSLWDRHRNAALLALVIIGIQLSLILALLAQRHRRQAAEAEAAEQRHQVAHLMRVSVLGELSGAIAHEINQPLTAILANAHAALDMVPEQAPASAELRETLQDIVSENNRASQVITRLRRLLTKNVKEFEAVNLNEVAIATTALLGSELARRKVALRTDFQPDLPAVLGDFIQIQQVLLNLLMNAMDAMERVPAADRLILVSTRATPGGTVGLWVRDRGMGLPPTGESQLFEPFYTTKPQGLGLGLPICRSIVQAHGGTLTLANAETRGTVAHLSLPDLSRGKGAHDGHGLSGR